MSEQGYNSSTGFLTREDLLKLCSSWSDKNMQLKIVQHLNSVDQDRVFNLFDSLLRDPDLEVRDCAIKMLMGFNPNRGVDLIIPLLTDTEEAWRWYICGALADYGDERAIEPLIQVLLNDPDDDTRYMAVVALGNIGDAQVIPVLQLVEEKDNGMDFEGRRISVRASKALSDIRARIRP
nr:HEAT repeat domain-containing protein [Oscillochloris trichoides]